MKTKLTEQDKHNYVERRGVSCPYCRSHDLLAGEWDTQDDAAFRTVTCLTCNRTWTDEYELTGITEHE